MAKVSLPSKKELQKYLSKEKLLPVYFICGDDDYGINQVINKIIQISEPLIKSDFDKEIITLEKGQNLIQLLDSALTFPFGGGKKLIVMKNFENVNEKKDLVGYISNPPEFTILIISNYGKISDASREPYTSLLKKNYIFEINSETGEELVEWIVNLSEKKGINFSEDNARVFIEIVGDEKSLLEMQLNKFVDYTPIDKQITSDDIKKIASPTNKYSIFDLLDALGSGNKVKAIEIAYNLLDSGVEIVTIVNMVAKFIMTIAQILELTKMKINDNEASKMVKVSWFYYVNCKKAKFLLSDARLLTSSRALLNADLAVKTTNTDSKTIITVLISELMADNIDI